MSEIMIYAWVLIYAIGYPYSFSISDIASQQECQKLTKAIISNGGWGNTADYKCFRYQKAPIHPSEGGGNGLVMNSSVGLFEREVVFACGMSRSRVDDALACDIVRRNHFEGNFQRMFDHVDIPVDLSVRRWCFPNVFKINEDSDAFPIFYKEKTLSSCLDIGTQLGAAGHPLIPSQIPEQERGDSQSYRKHPSKGFAIFIGEHAATIQRKTRPRGIDYRPFDNLLAVGCILLCGVFSVVAYALIIGRR